MNNIRLKSCPACGAKKIEVRKGEHYCWECRKNFGLPTYIQEAQTERIEFSLTEHITGICERVVLQRTEMGALLSAELVGGLFNDAVNVLLNTVKVPEHNAVPIGMRLFEEFVHSVYACYIVDWQEEYLNTHIINDKDWWLRVTFGDGSTLERMGSGGYPPHWRKFVRTIQKIKSYSPR